MSDSFYSMRQVRDMMADVVTNPLVHSNRTLYIEGAPGIGKTAMAHSVFDEHKRTKENPNGFTHFVNFVAPEREPTEVGLPMPNAQRTAITMMPLDEFIWKDGDRVFFLIDEIDKAPNMMQNVMGRVAHEHRVHNVILPSGSVVIMAGNRMTDRAGSFAANSHIKGRRTGIPAGVDHREWLVDVALKFDLHPAVVSYIRTSPDMLHKFDANAVACPSPRTWTKVGEALNHKKPDHVERAFIEGDIGKEAANTFWGHLRIHRDLRDPSVIIRDPEGAKIPTGQNSTAIMWAEVTALARYADKSNAEPIFRYLNRLPGEFTFCGYRDVLLRDKAIVAGSKAGGAWMMKNADMIIATRGIGK